MTGIFSSSLFFLSSTSLSVASDVDYARMANSFSVLNAPIGECNCAITAAYVPVSMYGEQSSSFGLLYYAVVFKSKLNVLSTSNLFIGNTSACNLTSRQ